MVSVIIGFLGMGALIGLIPLILGIIKHKTVIGIIGFVLCAVAGAFNLIISVVVAVVLSLIIFI